MYREILKNKIVVIFMRDQTSTVIVFIYSGIVLTEEQIMAHHDFFIRRYNMDADPIVRNHEACLEIIKFHR